MANNTDNGWSNIRHIFSWEGDLLDVSVSETSVEDWLKVLDQFNQNLELQFFTDENSTQNQADLQLIENHFAKPGNARPFLIISLDEITLNCHFIDSGMIEFDLDPRDIDSIEKFQQLAAFMKFLADATGKDAILSKEDEPENPICTVQAGSSEILMNI